MLSIIENGISWDMCWSRDRFLMCGELKETFSDTSNVIAKGKFLQTKGPYGRILLPRGQNFVRISGEKLP